MKNCQKKVYDKDGVKSTTHLLCVPATNLVEHPQVVDVRVCDTCTNESKALSIAKGMILGRIEHHKYKPSKELIQKVINMGGKEDVRESLLVGVTNGKDINETIAMAKELDIE